MPRETSPAVKSAHAASTAEDGGPKYCGSSGDCSMYICPESVYRSAPLNDTSVVERRCLRGSVLTLVFFCWNSEVVNTKVGGVAILKGAVSDKSYIFPSHEDKTTCQNARHYFPTQCLVSWMDLPRFIFLDEGLLFL